MPSVDGIVSGLDTTSLINSIVAVTALPQRAMETQLARLEDQKEKVAGLSNRLESLSGAIKDIWTRSSLETFTATAATDGQFTVSVGENAVDGVYAVQTLGLAAADSFISQGFADKTTEGVLGTGTLALTYGGEALSVDLDGNDTLADVASKLNDLDGITAWVVDTGSATDPYRLVVKGDDTGAENTVVLDASGLAGGTTPTFTQTTTAVDAHIQVNGIDLYSADNDFADQIPGLEIHATEIGAAPIQVTVEKDLDGLTERVQGFVDAYNEVVKYYKAQTIYDDEKGIKGALVGDSTARRVMDRLGGLVPLAQLGFSGGSEVKVALANIGIQTQRDGTLKLDTTALEDALDNDYDGVLNTLTGQHYASQKYASTTASVAQGTMTVKAGGKQVTLTIDGTNDTLQGVADALDDLAGVKARVADDGAGGYRLIVTDAVTGSTEDVEISGAPADDLGLTNNRGPLGVIVETIDDVFIDSEDGIITSRKESINKSIDDLEKQIEAFQARMDDYEQRLRAKFTAMEVALGQAQSTQSYLASVFASNDS